MPLRFALALLATAACAQWEAAPPRAGYFLDREGRLRALWGVAGSFVLGEARLEDVVSHASSPAWTVAKLERALVLLDASGEERARFAAPAGPAVFAFDTAGVPALVYFPEERLLCRIRGMILEPLRTLEQDVAAIAWIDEDRSLALVRGAGRLELHQFRPAPTSPGTLVGAFPWDGPALIAHRGRLLVAEGARLHLLQAGVALCDIEAPAPVIALHHMGADWVEVVTGDGGRLALRIGDAELRLYVLPEAAP